MKLMNFMFVMALMKSNFHQSATMSQNRKVFNVLVILSSAESRNESIFQEANRLIATKAVNYRKSSGNWSVKFSEYHLILSLSNPKTTLNFVNDIITNSSLAIDGVIFIEITKVTALLSQILRNVDFPTIGLHGSGHLKDDLPTDLFTYFSRVPTLPLYKIAFVMKDIINRMGWRKVLIIEIANMEGLKFAQSMVRFAKEEQWLSITTVMLDGEINGIRLDEIDKKISINNPDVIIINNLGRYINKVFLVANNSKSVWFLTDHAHMSVDQYPVGVLRLNQQSSRYHILQTQLLTDAMQFFVSAVEDTVTKLCHQARPCENNQSAIRQQVTSYISNDPVSDGDSVFSIPGPYDPPKQAFEFSNLIADQYGHRYWKSIGMWTPAGIALDTFIDQHGEKIVPPLVSPKSILRVPVVTVPAWMEIGKPYHHNAENTCLSGSPCYSVDSNGVKQTKFCCVGAQVDLINLLASDLDFNPFIYFTPDGKWGGFNGTTGQWTGLMKELTSHKADVTSLLGISKVRNVAVDFSQPYMELQMNILVRKNDSFLDDKVINWKFLDPFDLDLWLMIVGVTNIFLLVIWGLDRLSPHGHLRRIAALLDNESVPKDDGFTLLDSMSYVWGVAFSKDIGAENTPRSPSARVVSIFFAFMALILVNTYCAKLTAVLMEENFTPPIDGLRDKKLLNPSLRPPDGFKLGVVRGSLEEWYFRNHSDGHIQLLYNINIRINMVDNYKSGFLKLKDRKLDGLVGDTISLEAQSHNANCEYRLLGNSFYKFGVGFAFPKGSPWLSKATLSALKHQENGTIERIMKLRFPSRVCKSSGVREFGIQDFGGLFVTLLGVVFFGVSAFFVEFILIIILTKYWTIMGCLGKKLRYFFLGIKKNDTHDIDFHFCSSFNEKSWDLKHSRTAALNGHTDIRNGFHDSTAGLRNYGFSKSDLHDDWLRSRRVSSKSITSNEMHFDEELPSSQDRTVEIPNGVSNHVTGSFEEIAN